MAPPALLDASNVRPALASAAPSRGFQRHLVPGTRSRSGLRVVDAPGLGLDLPERSVQGPASTIHRGVDATEDTEPKVSPGVGVVQESRPRVLAEHDAGVLADLDPIRVALNCIA